MDPDRIPELAEKLRALGVERFRVDSVEVQFHPAAVVKPAPTDGLVLEAGELNAIKRRLAAEQAEDDLATELLSS